MPLIPEPEDFEDFLNRPADEGLEFFQAQRLFHANFDFETARPLRFLQDSQMVELSRHHFKSYAGKKRIPLEPGPLTMPIEQVIGGRRTERDLNPKFYVSHRQLSNLLYWAVGLRPDGGRNYPSPGGLYAHEVYVVIIRSENVAPGLYHYNVRENVLECLREEDPAEILKSVCKKESPEKFMAASHVVFLTCIFDRNIKKYGRRGWKFLQYETGVLIQNFYLVAKAAGLGSWPMGNIAEDELLGYLGIDGVTEGLMTSLWFGQPRVSGQKSSWIRLISDFGKSLLRASSSSKVRR